VSTFNPDLERLDERGIRNNLARRCAIMPCWDHAGLSHAEICGVIPDAEQQFGGSDDSANQDPWRSNSEGLKASNKS
jgi:hypothetical protein